MSESHLPARPGPPSADGAATLDDVLRARRSIRRFTTDVPSRVAVEAILEAGRLAPYGALALPSLADCRRFIVVARGTPPWAEAERLMNAQVTTHREFMALLGLESGAWDLDACAFGYPAQQPVKRELPALSELVRWLG